MKDKLNKLNTIARFINLKIMDKGEIRYLCDIENKPGNLDFYMNHWRQISEYWIAFVLYKLEEIGCRCYIKSDFVAIDIPKWQLIEMVKFKDFPNRQEAILECCYRAIVLHNKYSLIEEDV